METKTQNGIVVSLSELKKALVVVDSQMGVDKKDASDFNQVKIPKDNPVYEINASDFNHVKIPKDSTFLTFYLYSKEEYLGTLLVELI